MYVMCVRAWVERSVGVRAWWARAALTLAPEMAAQLACSEAGQGGVVRFTAQAWGTFTRGTFTMELIQSLDRAAPRVPLQL
jgi:hypothetical protein